jgi:hypothetical protein
MINNQDFKKYMEVVDPKKQAVSILSREVITLDQVAYLFQVSKITVLRWKKDRWISNFFKLGRRWYVRREDILKAMNFQIELRATSK